MRSLYFSVHRQKPPRLESRPAAASDETSSTLVPNVEPTKRPSTGTAGTDRTGATPSDGVRRRAAAVAVVAGLLATACGVSVGAAHPGSGTGRTRSDAAAPPPAAVLQAKAAFREQVRSAAAAFAAEVTTLQTTVERDDQAAARSDELAAQADYDRFRLLEAANSVNASTLDELASNVGPGQIFGGLHAVERDLWTSTGNAPADVAALEGQAPVADYLLSKDDLDPEAIGTTAVAELAWTADWAIPGREELYSRDDAVDIAATVGAAAAAFESVAPLGATAAPALTRSLRSDFSALVAAVAALGPPTQVVDSSIAEGERRSLTQLVDATAARLSDLAALLVRFGTHRPAAYPS